MPLVYTRKAVHRTVSQLFRHAASTTSVKSARVTLTSTTTPQLGHLPSGSTLTCDMRLLRHGPRSSARNTSPHLRAPCFRHFGAHARGALRGVGSIRPLGFACCGCVGGFWISPTPIGTPAAVAWTTLWPAQRNAPWSFFSELANKFYFTSHRGQALSRARETRAHCCAVWEETQPPGEMQRVLDCRESLWVRGL